MRTVLAPSAAPRQKKRQPVIVTAFSGTNSTPVVKLPAADVVNRWSSEQFVSALRHDPKNPEFNADLRQLIHVGFKVAAQLGDRYLKMLEDCEPAIAPNVTANLYDRHLKPLFVKQRD